ncbi:class I SAM-dependent methyltransferase [Clostridium formicaceticum]|uniref:Methyltransferase type 11 domain-containing protein n=1 Tax=Clostridium formicaceticum TaxID=1497 RepID=A0AAC9RMM5_9CLOT|nr:class I SAM-dependent methyltransferase [Clostridium formicaceticum]AOY77791.1 hypothetical protein BJL90_19150 [Clostridium formicaceticum]ARE88397.1 hypothetical protein CLFO_28000 [Clostridium formicaceticum]
MIVVDETCCICGNLSTFEIMEGAACFREAKCSSCGARLRNSDLARVLIDEIAYPSSSLKDCFHTFKEMRILEAQASGPIHEAFKQLPGYVCFEYFDGVKPGEFVDGILCNDLEHLTFDDNSFDMIITQDVMEHVINPDKAFAEISRVLKKNGRHIFTIPFHEGRSTIFRSELPQIHHGDPLRSSGALVNIDWGDDIGAFIDKHGMKTTSVIAHRFYRPEEITNVDQSYEEYLTTERIKYFRYNSIVFVSEKVEPE